MQMNGVVPARPAELTEQFLERVLGEGSGRVLSLSWKPLEVGVISEVVALHVTLETEEKELIAKFLRPEFPFEKMFIVESNFYTHFASSDELVAKFPFAVPKAIFLSTHLIILERVKPIATYSCVQGCPADAIPSVVTKLALMHGRYWHTDCSTLASSAGIGSELTGEAKLEQFPGCWQSFLDDIVLEADERDRLSSICQALSTNAQWLAQIHNVVANGPSTLIHGDFHAANLLFPSTESREARDTVWLVDWATCGTGNPMRDLAFFFIVGVRASDRAKHEAASLDTYINTIAQEGVTHLTAEEWKRHYRMCVVNQFLILVVYDNLSKHLASNAKTEKLRQELHAHFREVNRRACLAVLEHFVESEIAQLPSAL